MSQIEVTKSLWNCDAISSHLAATSTKVIEWKEFAGIISDKLNVPDSSICAVKFTDEKIIVFISK